MNDYTFDASVEFDLDDIWVYRRDSIDADRWIDKLFDTFEALARTPSMGHKREDLTSHSVLFWPVGRYLIICRAQSTTIQIVAVTQGSRDIPFFLRRSL